MEASSIDPGLLQLTEIILTAEAVNTNPALEVNDLPPHLRAIFCPEAAGVIARPVTIKEGVLKSHFPSLAARQLLENSKNSYLIVNDLSQFGVTSYLPALKWYFRHVGADIMKNPALTLSIETAGETSVSYSEARRTVPLFEDTEEALKGKIAAVTEKSESMKEAVDLVIPYAPNEIEFSLEDLVCSDEQLAIVKKVQTS
ncbi:MAG: ATP-binding protein, partial [Methanocorpusculum sp.]|nr:ATP-binding protein [Methanocorpusculum sp.]